MINNNKLIMKVALCISGQPRSALETFPYIKQNIILPNNADVFIHMHYDSDNPYMEKSHLDNGNCLYKTDIDKELIGLYEPKSYLVEKPRNFQNSSLCIDEKRLSRSKDMNKHKGWTDEEHKVHTIKQVTSMYYSIYKCNELKEVFSNENNIHYDYVIRIRFDLLPLEPIVCSMFNPKYINYLEMGQPDHMISDWINIGSNAVMNIYSSMYLNLEYMNTFDYYKLEDRISPEPSSKCGGTCEHLLRDLMYLYRIPKRGFRLNCRLN
jgi:hypothetical protein